jgi:hypothetical protein
MNMKTIIWDGKAFDGRSKEIMLEYTNGITTNVPIVVDDEGHYVAMQPWHTDQPGEWPTKEEALAWGARWIESLNSPAPEPDSEGPENQ